jgi:hypothetical protein
MANLIIKSSADNLVLQGSDASPAITVGATGTTTFAEECTLANATITTGTLGSAVVFNDAHKDIDVDADGWMRYVTVNQTASSAASIVWDGVNKMGSNITYDGTSDYIQVAKAGWYYIAVTYGHYAKTDQNVEIFVRKSQSTGATPSGNGVFPRIYGSTMNDGISYTTLSMSGLVYLAATDRVDTYGYFACYGSANVYDAMNHFTGVRLGA